MGFSSGSLSTKIAVSSMQICFYGSYGWVGLEMLAAYFQIISIYSIGLSSLAPFPPWKISGSTQVPLSVMSDKDKSEVKLSLSDLSSVTSKVLILKNENECWSWK